MVTKKKLVPWSVVFESINDWFRHAILRNGAKSYKKRLEEGKMTDFVVNRLAKTRIKRLSWCLNLRGPGGRKSIALEWLLALYYRTAIPSSKRRWNPPRSTLFMRSWMDSKGRRRHDRDFTCLGTLSASSSSKSWILKSSQAVLTD